MILFNEGDGLVGMLVFLTVTFWVVPITLFIAGLFKWKKEPERAKMLLIISGIWMIVGGGFCGIVLS